MPNRSFVSFLLAVIVPCTVAMLLAGEASRRATSQLRATSDEFVSRMALAAVREDLAKQAAEMAADAMPYPDADPERSEVRSALDGDTVVLVHFAGEQAELEVLLGEGAPGDRSAVREARSFTPSAAGQVGRITGYDVVVDLDGEGMPRASAEVGSLQPTSSVRPNAPYPPSVEPRIVVVLALLMLFSVLAGWIQLTPGPTGVQGRPRSVVALALVPALTATMFFVHVDRSFEVSANESLARDLTRGLAVARARGATGAATDVQRLTGFHSTLLRDGAVGETTFDGAPPQLTGIATPPRGFTASGTVQTPEGESRYVALRTEAAVVLVATARAPTAEVGSFRTVCIALGGGLLAWLLLVGAAASRLTREVPSASDRDRPDR